MPHTAASDLTLDEDAIFVLAYPSSDVLLVRQTSEGRCTAIELKFESIIPRFLSGIADKFRYVNTYTLFYIIIETLFLAQNQVITM